MMNSNNNINVNAATNNNSNINSNNLSNIGVTHFKNNDIMMMGIPGKSTDLPMRLSKSNGSLSSKYNSQSHLQSQISSQNPNQLQSQQIHRSSYSIKNSYPHSRVKNWA
ncbi:uncharacterized protein ASCRUDRAFT_74017 [Ascoidea rubescens DSM 1968]|uniref:Uncharacterized protein n=1 Tax=Ascoidea rubescens DSM 1968 TaxID=1344418 RepID=A0A1D2VS07_9ASCO|nr:hypothetical protein ASCRUDRAFT_74017 [Ascoidea rubescens DSM 1968]ODV64379.1 hypothetical protein ASCRUDRAFT_74017 [Ascoidea rubescens DSM 1968]